MGKMFTDIKTGVMIVLCLLIVAIFTFLVVRNW